MLLNHAKDICTYFAGKEKLKLKSESCKLPPVGVLMTVPFLAPLLSPLPIMFAYLSTFEPTS